MITPSFVRGTIIIVNGAQETSIYFTSANLHFVVLFWHLLGTSLTDTSWGNVARVFQLTHTILKVQNLQINFFLNKKITGSQHEVNVRKEGGKRALQKSSSMYVFHKAVCLSTNWHPGISTLTLVHRATMWPWGDRDAAGEDSTCISAHTFSPSTFWGLHRSVYSKLSMTPSGENPEVNHCGLQWCLWFNVVNTGCSLRLSPKQIIFTTTELFSDVLSKALGSGLWTWLLSCFFLSIACISLFWNRKESKVSSWLHSPAITWISWCLPWSFNATGWGMLLHTNYHQLILWSPDWIIIKSSLHVLHPVIDIRNERKKRLSSSCIRLKNFTFQNQGKIKKKK